MTIYPTQKAVAFKLEYSPKWKLGDSPKRINLGFVLYPVNCYVEDGEMALRRVFPNANAVRHYDEHGKIFCCGSL